MELNYFLSRVFLGAGCPLVQQGLAARLLEAAQDLSVDLQLLHVHLFSSRVEELAGLALFKSTLLLRLLLMHLSRLF